MLGVFQICRHSCHCPASSLGGRVQICSRLLLVWCLVGAQHTGLHLCEAAVAAICGRLHHALHPTFTTNFGHYRSGHYCMVTFRPTVCSACRVTVTVLGVHGWNLLCFVGVDKLQLLRQAGGQQLQPTGPPARPADMVGTISAGQGGCCPFTYVKGSLKRTP